MREAEMADLKKQFDETTSSLNSALDPTSFKTDMEKLISDPMALDAASATSTPATPPSDPTAPVATPATTPEATPPSDPVALGTAPVAPAADIAVPMPELPPPPETKDFADAGAPQPSPPAACARAAPARAGGRRGQGGMKTEEDEKEIEATKAPLMEHLIELRSRLIKALVAFFLTFIVCFFFAKRHLQRADLAVRVDRGPGAHEVHLHGAARVFLDPAQARDVRRGVHLVPGDRDADLHVRRARPLPPRAPRLPAVSGRDAVLLRARRARSSISS